VVSVLKESVYMLVGQWWGETLRVGASLCPVWGVLGARGIRVHAIRSVGGEEIPRGDLLRTGVGCWMGCCFLCSFSGLL
jgi:hypothetical protein